MHKFIAAFAIAALSATPALAGERSAVVHHADLDLKSDAGRAELNRRLASATESVCGSYAGASSAEQHDILLCRNDVKRQIAAQLTTRWGTATMARR